MKPWSTRASGRAYETRALAYLRDHGLTLEQRNFSCKTGEIDLVMRDGDVTVFVEVRQRHHRGYGGALASIDAGKQRRIANTALLYLKRKYSACDLPMRFDVVTIDGPANEIKWLRSAFEF